jgi:hypothetical protein
MIFAEGLRCANLLNIYWRKPISPRPWLYYTANNPSQPQGIESICHYSLYTAKPHYRNNHNYRRTVIAVFYRYPNDIILP